MPQYNDRGHGGSRRRALLLVLAVMVLMMSSSVFLGKASASEMDGGETGTGTLQSYVDDETGEIKTFDSTEQFSVEVVNLSKYRADVYWDDGKYGVSIATVEAEGGSAGLTTFQGHSFFVTRHGVRTNLYGEEVEGEEDTPLKFYAEKPNQKMVIPKEASTLSGERAARNRCVDRYEMCKGEGTKQNQNSSSFCFWKSERNKISFAWYS